MKTVIWAILLNQLGFYTHSSKIAIVSGQPSGSVFYVVHIPSGDTAYSGRLSAAVADFSAVEKEGDYKLIVPGLGSSYPFHIGGHMAAPVARAALKGYYYQRSDMALDERYAGIWHRLAGHPDTQVFVHPSAASRGRPAGTVISSPGGWYDAGDYNKYIVNSGITMGTLLAAYEDFSGLFDTLHTNIPVLSGVPDLLNECLYNLRWMFTMQDPEDGGVYHKCTNTAFDGMVMPGVTRAPRYVVQKGTAATLDFAAVMSQAGRIFKKFPRQLPGLADSCIHAARTAWQWAIQHPSDVYDQDALNKVFKPAINTGGYGDRDMRDEWYWAAAELLVTMGSADYGDTTGNAAYRDTLLARFDDPGGLPSWANVHMLGDYTLLHHPGILPARMMASLKEHLLQMADNYWKLSQSSVFHTVMGASVRDFVWGSNSVAANQGVLLIQAALLTKDKRYVDAAMGNLDYLLGRNATGYCFITGMGSYSPMHPHHRPSVADGIIPPVPGLLVGGPNPGRQDHQAYVTTDPQTAYLDDARAYASNEIAINWNAPLVYLAGALEALH